MKTPIVSLRLQDNIVILFWEVLVKVGWLLSEHWQPLPWPEVQPILLWCNLSGWGPADWSSHCKHPLFEDCIKKKSRIRETSNHSTDADFRTDTILESLRDLSRKKKKKKRVGWRVYASTHTRVRASTRRIHAGAMDALHPPPVFRAPRV